MGEDGERTVRVVARRSRRRRFEAHGRDPAAAVHPPRAVRRRSRALPDRVRARRRRRRRAHRRAPLHARAARRRSRGAAFERGRVVLHVGPGTFRPADVDRIRRATAWTRSGSRCDEAAAGARARRARARRPHRRGRHDGRARARVRVRRERAADAGAASGCDAQIHPDALHVPGRRRAASPTSTCRARRCCCWSPRSRARGRCARAYAHAVARALPLLLVRGRDAHRVSAQRRRRRRDHPERRRVSCRERLSVGNDFRSAGGATPGQGRRDAHRVAVVVSIDRAFRELVPAVPTGNRRGPCRRFATAVIRPGSGS